MFVYLYYSDLKPGTENWHSFPGKLSPFFLVYTVFMIPVLRTMQLFLQFTGHYKDGQDITVINC
jgi:hypothetical protein